MDGEAQEERGGLEEHLVLKMVGVMSLVMGECEVLVQEMVETAVKDERWETAVVNETLSPEETEKSALMVE